MGESADLYERDFVAWTEEQAARIRAAAGTHPDPSSTGTGSRRRSKAWAGPPARELRGRLTTIIEHLLKLRHSPAEEPRAGWLETVVRERTQAENLLDENPSLRAKLGVLLRRANRAAAKTVGVGLEARREIGPAEARALGVPELTPDQVLGEWFPNRPPAPAGGRP